MALKPAFWADTSDPRNEIPLTALAPLEQIILLFLTFLSSTYVWFLVGGVSSSVVHFTKKQGGLMMGV